jgi:hypothetical protein
MKHLTVEALARGLAKLLEEKPELADAPVLFLYDTAFSQRLLKINSVVYAKVDKNLSLILSDVDGEEMVKRYKK